MSDIVYMDSCAFLAWLKGESGRAEVIEAIFDEAAKGKIKILTSTLTIAEVLNIQGAKSPIPKEQREKVKSLFANEWIVPKGVNRRFAEISQDMVWDHGIKPKDGIHVATAMVYKVTAFYTYDDGLIKKGHLKTAYGEVQISEPLPPAQGELKLEEKDGKGKTGTDSAK